VVEALQQCPSRSLEGIDVFDGQGAIDWPAVADAGVVFAVIKATQGTYDTQSTFAFNWGAARQAGLRRAAYHFFDPTDDGASQAQRFIDVVTPVEPGDLPPVLDIECPDGDADCLGNGAAGNAPATLIASRMWDWIHAVESATGAKPVVYTFADYFASNGIDPSGLDAYPLFLAQPSRSSPAACLSVPAPWSQATMWQYSWSGSVSGIQIPVDRDRFLGSAGDLAALALAVGNPAVEPAPEAGPIVATFGAESGAPPGSPGCP
jgi:lysozyme